MFLLSGIALVAINYLLLRVALPPIVGTGRVDTEGQTPTAMVVPISEIKIAAEYRLDVLKTLLAQSGVTLIVTVLVAMLMGWIAASRMLKPVRAMTSIARRLSAENIDHRISMAGPRDELTDLADTFDAMLDRLAASFDSQRRFVANASHELRTPLAAQRTLVEVAMARPATDPAARELYAHLLTMNGRIESMIEGLLVLARSDRGLDASEPVRLDLVAEAVIDIQREAAAEVGLQIHSELEPRIVQGDQMLMERLVSNLVSNAIKYNHPGGQVWVRVAEEPAVWVGNTGPLVPMECTPDLFEPFRQLQRRLDGKGHGVGLGLSIVASVARAHGGSVRADPRIEGGLEVVVHLPYLDSPRQHSDPLRP